MSNESIITVMFCVGLIVFLLAKWDCLPQHKGKDYLLKYYRGDDLMGKW